MWYPSICSTWQLQSPISMILISSCWITTTIYKTVKKAAMKRQNRRYHMKEHKNLDQTQVSKVILHFVCAVTYRENKQWTDANLECAFVESALVFVAPKIWRALVIHYFFSLPNQLQMLQEVHLMKLVQHPHVVRLYEVIDTATKVWPLTQFFSVSFS